MTNHSRTRTRTRTTTTGADTPTMTMNDASTSTRQPRPSKQGRRTVTVLHGGDGQAGPPTTPTALRATASQGGSRVLLADDDGTVSDCHQPHLSRARGVLFHVCFSCIILWLDTDGFGLLDGAHRECTKKLNKDSNARNYSMLQISIVNA
jgi:hypothetical protein